jgi:hypothetical protein
LRWSRGGIRRHRLRETGTWQAGTANGTSSGVIGTSVIAGHVDSHQGPAVFCKLGALK